jgi:uncharacterized protein (TIGR00369 family)
MSTAATDRSRTIVWSDPAEAARAALELPGLEAIRALADGRLPRPPIAELLDMDIAEVDEGRVVFGLTPAEWMYNPIGSVHGGIACTLLDSAMGCAVQTVLAAGVGYTTSDLQVRMVRGMSAETGRVLCEGRVVHPGRRTVTAEGRITRAADGRLLAHGTTGCLVLG